ncbi:MAG: cell division protein FtsX [Lewinella sp.]|jgi:cell division transport system permease protein|uniref:cell division protein FtsX n=1 Tax=Lewinella sp. TaxID=2004506 RepID=UPI003D6B2B8E
MSKPQQQPPQHRPNYLYTIISVAAVLFLLGFFGLLLLQSQRLTKVLKEQVDIIVELTNTPADSARLALENKLSKSSFVIPQSVEFTSREEALELMSDDLGEDLLSLDLPNPLYDVYTFNVGALYLTPDSLQRIREVLIKDPIINDVYYQESLIDQLTRNIKRISWILLGIAALFVLLALTVIHNTIRLALYANRFLIKTQELVGARWEFISRPYLRKSLWHGLLSALLAIGLLLLLQFWFQQQIPEIRALQHPLAFASLFAGLIILGMVINWLSTYVVVRKYLRMREDELY